MSVEIMPIGIPMPLNLGNVNCYLLKAESGFLLVDSGTPFGRIYLEKELERLGCHPGSLHLIVLTHGDFDHTGSAAYLRQMYRSQIAMHPDDVGMAEHAYMFWNREKGNFLFSKLVPLLFGFTKKARFTPDVLVQDGFDLSEYGLEACILGLPGHSKGSIGILTSSGDLFCGDLLMNDKDQPSFGFGDPAGFLPSINRLKGMRIRTVYPGHGSPLQAHPGLWDNLTRAS
jgi:hydroxyacylglutathione hydrolase